MHLSFPFLRTRRSRGGPPAADLPRPVEEAELRVELDDSKKPGKKTKKKQVEPPDPGPVRFGRGVETMYRNAYRLKLDLTTLADGKANIMLSINSISFTMLMIGGGFIASTEPWLLAPIGVFLVSSVSAMVFAVLAARPHVIKSKHTRDDLMAGDGDILYFNNFTKLSSDEYVRTLQGMLSDNPRIYNQMARTMYGLGVTVDRKFRLLKISYSIFLGGLIVTVLTFALARLVSIETAAAAESMTSSEATPIGSESSTLAAFQGIYEPSGVHQLPDGRVLVVEDEKARALNLLSARDGGRFSEIRVPRAELSSSGLGTLSDLEGLDASRGGDIYAITSHSRTRDGRTRKNREKLVRFRLDGETITAAQISVGLKAALGNAHPLLGRAAAFADPRDARGFNIEGLAFDENQDRLLIGFRTPVVDGKALIASIDNPREIFDRGEAPRISRDLTYLDLDGGGIRGMTYDERKHGFLIIGARGDSTFRLWFWDGHADHSARPMAIRGVDSLPRVEGIAPLRWQGEDRLLIVSDDGFAADDEPGHYLIVDYDQLVIE